MDTFLKRKNESNCVILPKVSNIQSKYNPDFIRFGFVNGGDNVEPRAQHVECGLTLSKEALKPSKLKRHLETRHPALAEKPVQYFKRKENGLLLQKTLSTLATQSNSA